jgi:hypothetical protein
MVRYSRQQQKAVAPKLGQAWQLERMRAWCGAVRSSVAWLLCIVHRPCAGAHLQAPTEKQMQGLLILGTAVLWWQAGCAAFARLWDRTIPTWRVTDHCQHLVPLRL